MNENVIVILFLMLLAAVVAVVRWIVGNLCVKVDDTIHETRISCFLLSNSACEITPASRRLFSLVRRSI